MRSTVKKQKSNALPPELQLVSFALQEELRRFMEYHPPHRLNRNLRKMMIEYLMQESALEELYLKDLLYDLQGLFELCDAMEMEAD